MFLLLVLIASSFSFADPIIMKIGTEDPAGSWQHHGGAMVETFIQEVAARSNGRIQVEYYPNRQLGNGESMLAQTRRGIIQVSLQNDGVVGSIYAPLQVLSIPYLFSDREVAWQVLDGPFGQKLSDDMARQTGLRVLKWTESGGFRHYTNNKREIRTPADMRGLKIRTMNVPLHMQIVKDLGASPTPISWSELYTSLQTGVVDGQENSVSTFRVPKLEEVQKYMVLDGHVYAVLMLVFNEQWFQGLPKDLQDVVRNSMEVAGMAERGTSVVGEFVGLQALTQYGVKIYKPSVAEKKMFRDATQASAIQFLRNDQKVGSRWVNDVQSAVEAVERQLGYR
jgi:C4-dicarboxylate-binding protein DctP